MPSVSNQTPSIYTARKALRILKKVNKKAYKEISWINNKNYTYEKVESITKHEKIDVYDITVKDAENFTANGLVVHNCKHLLRSGLMIVSKKY